MAVVDPVRVLVCQDVCVVGTRDASVDVILSWPFTRSQGTTNELSQASLKTRRCPYTVVPAKLVLEKKENLNPVPWTVFKPTAPEFDCFEAVSKCRGGDWCRSSGIDI